MFLDDDLPHGRGGALRGLGSGFAKPRLAEGAYSKGLAREGGSGGLGVGVGRRKVEKTDWFALPPLTVFGMIPERYKSLVYDVLVTRPPQQDK